MTDKAEQAAPASAKPRKGDAARARSREVQAAKKARGEVTDRSRRIPWKDIRLAFETDLTTTLRGLARRYRVNAWALTARAKEEGWAESREETRLQVEAAARRNAIAKLAKAASSQALRAAADLEGARVRILARLGVQLGPGDDKPADSARSIVETEETDKDGKITRRRAITSSLGVANPLSVAVLRQETALLKALLGLRQPSDGRSAPDEDDPSPPVVIT